MSIQLSATRRALESVVEAATGQQGEELQATCNYYVDLAKTQVENKIPQARRRHPKITAIRTGGFLVQS